MAIKSRNALSKSVNNPPIPPMPINEGMPPTLQKPEEGSAPLTHKNFRNHPDMENFFRFIYEHDLRIEALQIIDEIIATRQARRKKVELNSNSKLKLEL